MSLTYTTYVSQLSNLMVVSSTNAEFQIFLPGCIDYAEQRMYRETDLLATRVTDVSGLLTPNVRTFSFPTAQGTFLVIEEINVFTPVGAGNSSGTRNPLVMVAKEFIDTIYPSAQSNTGLPQFMAMVANTTVILGPSPDSSYSVAVVGTVRPTPLSSTTTSTILTTMLPDAFMAASMVFASGYQRDFGGQSDNPAQSASWESEYSKLMQSVNSEEMRKKHQSQGWTSQQPNPIATPPRV